MLTYLRTAEEVLRWQAEHGDKHTVEPRSHSLLLGSSVIRFCELLSAHQASNAFDVETALILLWDKTSALLPSFQVKSKPL